MTILDKMVAALLMAIATGISAAATSPKARDAVLAHGAWADRSR